MVGVRAQPDRALSPRAALAAKGGSIGAMLVVVLMLAGSSLAMAAHSTAMSSFGPGAHVATPVGSGHAAAVSVHPAVQVPTNLPHSARSASPPPAAARPASNNTSYDESGRATFFSQATIPNPSAPNNTCKAYYLSYMYCWNTTSEPSLNATTDGYTGLAYTAFTNQSPCAAMSPNATSEVGFVSSTDFGLTWNNPIYLGNPVCTGLPDVNYTSAFEPSLTSLPNGTFVMTYIEYNSTGVYAYYATPPSAMLCGYTHSSRVVVTESYDHGVTWTTPVTINGAEYNKSINTCPLNNFVDVRPQITAFGNTIYLVWTNISDPIENYNFYNPAYSAGVHLISSTDGGATWSSITTFTPMDNNVYGTATDYATNPAVLVDPSGRLYIAYATNYATTTVCLSYCDTFVSASLVVATSTNNGSTFSMTHAADNVLAPYPSFYPYVYWDPIPTLAFNPVSQQVYLAYSAGVFNNWCYDEGSYGIYCNPYAYDKIFFQNSSDFGATWSTATNPSPFNPTQDWQSPAYNPSMAVDVNGKVHLTYAWLNEGLCVNFTAPYTGYHCAPVQEMYVNSTDNGTTWSSPLVVSNDWTYTYGPYREIWDGFSSAALTEGTQVLFGWTKVNCPNVFTTGCQLPWFSTAPSLPANSAEVTTSRLYEAVGLTLTFNETGAPANSVWSVDINGNTRNGPAGVNLSISGVPPSLSVSWLTPWINQSYGVAFFPTYSVTPPSAFLANTTIKETFSELVLVNLLTVPGLQATYFTSIYSSAVSITPGPGPVWVTKATPQTFTESSIPLYSYCYACPNLTFQSWTGTGPGSVNSNASSITFTPMGPMNETANFGWSGLIWGSGYTSFGYPSSMNFTYDLNFQEVGLPAGTSWGLTLVGPDGTALSQTGPASVMQFQVGTGLVGFQAWTVPASGGMFWVPSASETTPLSLPQSSSVLITYSLESVSSAQFVTTFGESGLPNLTAWGLQVGLASYGMTSSNGTVTLNGGASDSVDGSPVYLSNGTGYYVSSITVTPWVINQSAFNIAPGGSFTVNGSAQVILHYSPMYRVTVSASVGGTATPDSVWVHQGSSIGLGETALAGYHFVGWSGTGTGSYSGGTTNPSVSPRAVVTELATFRPNAPPTWNVTLQAIGLPLGTPFTISIGSVTYSGLGAFKVGNITDGVYSFGVPTVYLNSSQTTRFNPTDVSSDLVAGGMLNITQNGTLSITYTTQYAISIAGTPGGSVSWGTSGSVGIYWLNASSQVSFYAIPDPHYYFVGWNGTGAGSVTASSQTVTLQVTGPATETAQFQWRPNQPPATYWLTVAESGLPMGTGWSVAVGGLGAAGTNGTLTVIGLNGSYALTAPTIYSAPGVRWVSDAVNVSKSVTANGTFTVTFTEQFQVTILGATGGTITPLGTQWVAPGTVVSLTAVANSTSVFLSWNGTGTGNYTGVTASTTVTVNAPITEQVAFGPKPVTTTTSSGAGNGEFMSLGLLAALLIAGLVVGLLLGRRRSAQPPMSEEVPAGEEAPMDPSQEMAAPPMAEYDEGPAQN